LVRLWPPKQVVRGLAKLQLGAAMIGFYVRGAVTIGPDQTARTEHEAI
jgi:hypothetical protein